LPDGAHCVPTSGATPWWVRVDGAYWNAPEGPGSDVSRRPDHPPAQWKLESVRQDPWYGAPRLVTGATRRRHRQRAGLFSNQQQSSPKKPPDANSGNKRRMLNAGSFSSNLTDGPARPRLSTAMGASVACPSCRTSASSRSSR
jgi:hypothetical protein